MIDVDEFYKKIEREMVVDRLRSTGVMENSMWQHIGKVYNKSFGYQGKLADEFFANLDRQLAGRKPHGYQQNKKTEFEKLVEKGKKEE